MRVLIGNNWQDECLDYFKPTDSYRLKILAYCTIARLTNIYFVRPKSFQLLWNYILEIGMKDVLRKIVSRNGERHRNEKFISCGLGIILERSDTFGFEEGELVAFIAPCHPRCVERVVIPEELLFSIARPDWLPKTHENIFYRDIAKGKAPSESLLSYSGWNCYSGNPLPRLTEDVKNEISGYFHDHLWRDACRLPVVKPTDVNEFNEKTIPVAEEKKRGVIYGFGNYAKTIILPNVKPFVGIETIHEIDPLQIVTNKSKNLSWDTSPEPRLSKLYDVYFIAGYHHTHAPLAIHALKNNAYAVVEKPVCVDHNQLASLLEAMTNTHGALFSCFHKRYLPFNSYALEDLGVTTNTPISYHCIVYEVPLPELHWYRWPNSKSRLVSNGCQWLDHFLYLNEYSEIAECDITISSDRSINCSVELINGAFFTMVLTDIGSGRVGVQDYIQLRSNGITVEMINGAHYKSESSSRILRKRSVNKMMSYKIMYDNICRNIYLNKKGDSVESVKVSSGLVLALEKLLQ